MSRSHNKHLEPRKYRDRDPNPDTTMRVKRVIKSHKQKRVNERAKLRKEYL